MFYAPRPERYDEVFESDGRPRSHWKVLADIVQGTSQEALVQRANTVRRAVEQDGVTYNIYGGPEGTDRPWEVDSLPFVIAADEWRVLATAVEQRARLLDRVLADLYGRSWLIAEGLLPPAVVYGHHNYLWPCRGIRPPGDRYLHLYACDIARSPDGRWWVIGDRTQSPSGAGYALQNRLIVTPLYERSFRSLEVQRLAGFFRTLQQQLAALAPATDEAPLVALLTPGPFNETYFEHVFLARYLGFVLVEGSDLTVRDDRLYLKTLEGLRRVHALVRRLDDEYCDPAALRADSTLGVAGLISAARAGNVLLANVLGSGVLESSALPGFLPAICERLLGESLKIPSVATWWCGERPALEYVIDHLPELVIKPAFPSMKLEPTFGHTLDRRARAAMAERLRATPHAFVAQEWVRLSQAPTWSRETERFESRVVGLRLYATAKGAGYEVMPGGLARVAPESETDVITMQRGGSSKDVWVPGDGIAAWQSLLKPSIGARQVVRAGFYSPSRAVENLFWMGRYSERVDNVARLLSAVLNRLLESDPSRLEAVRVLSCFAETAQVREASGTPEGDSPVESPDGSDRWALEAIGNPKIANGIPANTLPLLHCATQLRDRLSSANWRAIQGLAHAHEPAPRSLEDGLWALGRVLPTCTALAGYAFDDMTRDDAWRFLVMGRQLERITFLSSLTNEIVGLPRANADSVLNSLLEIGNSSLTYRVRYQRHPELLPVLDLLLLDDSNPHSLCFQFEALVEQLDKLHAKLGFDASNDPRRVLRLLRDIDLSPFEKGENDSRPAGESLAVPLSMCERCAYALSDEITQRFFVHAGEKPQSSAAA